MSSFKLSFTLLLCVIAAVHASDLDIIVKRLEELERNENHLKQLLQLQENRVGELEKESKNKDKVIAELNNRISLLEKLEQTKDLPTKTSIQHTESVSDIPGNQNNLFGEKTSDQGETFTQTAVAQRRRNARKRFAGSERFVASPEVGVAFHVVLTGGEHAHYGDKQVVIFDTVKLNIGDGYHPNHGLFIAPMDGIYVFSASILSFVDPKPEFSAIIAKNGQALGFIYGHGDSGRHDQGSNTVVVLLNQSDEVTIEISGQDRSIWGGSYTSFTGFLLMPL